MSRTLERRAEAIKAHFDNNSKMAKLRDARLQAQVCELRAGLEASTHNQSEAEERHLVLRQQCELKCAALEEEVAELSRMLAAQKSTQEHKLDALLAEEKGKFTRLEMEYVLLQREIGKKDVKVKTYQRDVLRLQASLAALAEDKVSKV